jgi:hypothetical protein
MRPLHPGSGRFLCFFVVTAEFALAAHAFAATTGARAVPSNLVGCWSRRAPALEGVSAGVWSIAIKKSGTLVAFTPGTNCGANGDFTGALSVNANRLTIGQLPVCPNRGTYRWKVSGRSLTLHALVDKCPSRLGLFSGIWKKK